ncbi:MAG: SMP-30/gluconolactonase/LRE family protein [Chloroflexota bacterium]
MTDTLMPLDAFTPFVEGLDHPEGVAWGPDGFIYAGGEAGQIYRINLDTGNFEEIANTGGFVLGLCLDAASNIYACDHVKQCVFRITQSGQVSVYASSSPERKMSVPNYPVFDKAGNLYVSDSGGWDEANGCLFRVTSAGETELIDAGPFPFPNGLALSPDGSELYMVLSNLPGVGKFPLQDSGAVGPLETVVELPENEVPDGLAFDSQGNLFISCYTPSRIYRLTPNGDLVILAEDPRNTTLSAPTNIAFCRNDLTTLAVASLGRWHLSRAEMDIAGQPLWYPNL